jgi:hypothetical protein
MFARVHYLRALKKRSFPSLLQDSGGRDDHGSQISEVKHRAVPEGMKKRAAFSQSRGDPFEKQTTPMLESTDFFWGLVCRQ